MHNIHYIDQAKLDGSIRVLLRVDFNITLSPHNEIGDDARIRAALPTIEYILQHPQVTLIIMSHLGRPKGKEDRYSMKPVRDRLASLLPPGYSVVLVEDIESAKTALVHQDKTVYLLGNLRFWEGEKTGDPAFAQTLASLGDIYVNDAFGASHRPDASIVGIPKLLPSYAGLLMKKEIEHIDNAVSHPAHPVVAIIGGIKVTTKLALLKKLTDIADTLIVGGGLATVFLKAAGYEVGKSVLVAEEVPLAQEFLVFAKKHNTHLLLPDDVVVGDPADEHTGGAVKLVAEVGASDMILDIGPETQAKMGTVLSDAKTIIWNGPVGYMENLQYRRGTDYLYYAIAQNRQALSIVGGGDTLSAISKKEYLDHITHISTGGGAMLEYIEKGTLPGIEALKDAA
ncbi:phosphoglycerate kinase [Candidatus Roizmanbacteria bacterium CG10_big_fil_rev_8_21_14_0_10_45_7]|uniref:Phosphoglycerate kinase n=1 Tax=Candidatus Roizmanbacteria bacterium CG10_big_fil_rev_8_21_14_0_10_45_7 TaxID=1974854 RepID=A0A2M8KUJ4_9BACT|nr:MAG: phosphoglycerate kinase [Candidatus Roizmanbacteria bacterium CG10_big_fil_rev_8_21_14_0_10_45_7]